MPFESLSFHHALELPQVPHRWLPLIHLYDADLPLFPIYYFHTISSAVPIGVRPLVTERAFGYVEHVNLRPAGGIEVGIVCNKDLSLPENAVFRGPVETEVQERFGIANPVRLQDIENTFQPPLVHANAVIPELWHRVVANAYGNLLPFGRLWDETLGLARFVASWFSQSGRKGELIQTHYFATRFGASIHSAAGIPQVDFFLLPTIRELTDPTDPLNDFPEFRPLLDVADRFAAHYGARTVVNGVQLTRFVRPALGRFDSAALFNIIQGINIPHALRPAAVECFNAFGKGPPRTLIFLLMLHDLRNGLLQPAALTSAQCASIYDGLGRTYQSPKVIEIYAQQCFGNTEAMPVDTWIETFLRWPLHVYPTARSATTFFDIFSNATRLGKLERLLWVTGQARKVHSSACDDAVWCIKYGSGSDPRGANPLGCNICLPAIRNACPAHAAVLNSTVGFNGADPAADFQITTTAGDNVTPNQRFVSCRGHSIYSVIQDDFSAADDPNGFAPFPAAGHDGGTLTVQQFVNIY
jgi:hypothetical protein